jgi:hypothetical protein
MRLGISRVSPILAKLIRSVLPSIVGLTTIKTITPFNKIDIRVFTSVPTYAIMELQKCLRRSRAVQWVWSRAAAPATYTKFPDFARIFWHSHKNAQNQSNYNAVYYYSNKKSSCQEVLKYFLNFL